MVLLLCAMLGSADERAGGVRPALLPHLRLLRQRAYRAALRVYFVQSVRVYIVRGADRTCAGGRVDEQRSEHRAGADGLASEGTGCNLGPFWGPH